MNRINVRIALCSALLFAGACEQSETGGTKTEVTHAVVTPTSAAVAPVAVAPVEAADESARCAGAEGKEHSGMECMKKSADMVEAGEGMGCNQWDDDADKVAQRDVPTDAHWNVLSVSGMTCGGCERRIIANVGKLDGVVSVEADAELGKVRVAVAKGHATAGNAAKAKILELGYSIQ